MQWPNDLMKSYDEFIFRGLFVIYGIITNFASGFIFHVDRPDVELTSTGLHGSPMEC